MNRRLTRTFGAGLALALLAPACSAAEPEEVASGSRLFSEHWSDGRAEIDGYELVQPRYGQERRGRAVLIFVTEPFSRDRLVKVDRHEPSDPDQLVVLKLNEVRKFQTGIYDYSLMTSVFVDPVRGFAPLVSRFSAQEWCGHTWDESVVDGGSATVRTESYFEGETGTATVELGADGILEDALPILLRSLAGAELEARDWSGKLLESATRRRLGHRPARAVAAEIHWSEAPETVEVPAGSFAARVATLSREGGASCRYAVEVAYPHRILSWSCSDGERATLTGSERIAYWRTHGEGDEAPLEKLGLSPMGVAP